jgi:hypothetical protein
MGKEQEKRPMKKFRMVSDVVFEAESIDDAMAKLAKHFASFETETQDEDGLEFNGDIEIVPLDDSE